MDQRIKKLWCDALRSGEYEQGKYHLQWDGKLCCLGVLSDLHAKETGGQWACGSGKGKSYLDESEYLPPQVMHWAGLQERQPLVTFSGQRRTLDDLNDDDVSFTAIAALIEEYL